MLAQLSEIEAERDAAVEVSRASSGKVGLLTRLKGIGPEIATMLQLEAFFRSFANRREVAAYAGLAPMPWKSGRLDREQDLQGRQPAPRTRWWSWPGCGCATSRAALSSWFASVSAKPRAGCAASLSSR